MHKLSRAIKELDEVKKEVRTYNRQARGIDNTIALIEHDIELTGQDPILIAKWVRARVNELRRELNSLSIFIDHLDGLITDPDSED